LIYDILVVLKGAEYYPISHPQITNDILESKPLQRMILDLAAILNIRQLFLDVSDDDTDEN
jgi:hypothetical protein